MKKLFLTVIILAMLLSLTACVIVPLPMDQTSTDPTESDELPQLPPQPGYYIASSVGENGDITFFSSLDPANGYIRLNADHTGVIFWEDAEQDLTWEEDALRRGDEIIPCYYTSYYDPELDAEEAMLMIYFMDAQVSVVFRPAEDPAGA